MCIYEILFQWGASERKDLVIFRFLHANQGEWWKCLPKKRVRKDRAGKKEGWSWS